MLANIIITLAGILIFLFLFWRRLKEDYPSEIVFTTSVFMLLGTSLGLLLSKKFIPAFWFWGAFSGASLGLLIGVLRYKLRIFEVMEAGTLGLLPWLGIAFLGDSIINSSLPSFLAFFAITCLVTLFAFLDSHYKNFAWYRSGRVGFSGLTTLALFFLLRAGFAPFFPFVISFTGRQDAILSAVVAFAFFLLTFNLARRTI